MDKLKFLSQLSDGDEKILFSNIFDKIKKSAYSSYPLFTSFLTPSEQKRLDERKRIAEKVNFISFGGYKNAERKMYAFSTDENIDFNVFPVDKIKISTKDKKVFDHRAYLGSVLSLGIKREKIGDIVIMDEFAIIFCVNDITEFLLYNLNKISNSFVDCEIYYEEVEIDDVRLQLSAMGSRLDASVWFVDRDGNMLASSYSNNYPSAPVSIDNFNPVENGTAPYQIDNYHGFFPEDVITVISPVISSYMPKGYLLIHKNISDLEPVQDEFMNTVYITEPTATAKELTGRKYRVLQALSALP